MMAEIESSGNQPLGPFVDPPITSARPSLVHLIGSWVRLEPLDPSIHSSTLWESIGGVQNSDLWRYMSDGPFEDRAHFDAHLSELTGLTEPFFFAIIDSGTGNAVGRCAYMNIKPEHRCIEIGNIVFARSLQRTRGATEALYLLARHAFEHLLYRRYEWKCNALNSRSRKAAERFGYVFEGIFRNHMIIKGRSRDTAWYSMLLSEWPAVKRSLEAWMAPENFDASGSQLRRLRNMV